MITMKKLTSLLIGCSLALAGAALAQQPVEQQSPSKNKHAPEKSHATQAQPRPNAAKPQAPPATHQGATHEHAATHQPGAMQKTHAGHESANAAETNVPAKSTNEPGAGKGRKARAHEGTRNLQMLPPPKRMYLVVRQECRRTAGSRRLRSESKV